MYMLGAYVHVYVRAYIYNHLLCEGKRARELSTENEGEGEIHHKHIITLIDEIKISNLY